MKLAFLMTLNAFLASVFGLGFLLLPEYMLTTYGATPSAELLQMARFFGSALLGYGLLAWFGRQVKDPSAQRAIVLGLGLSFIIGFVVALTGQLSGVVGDFGWVTVILYLLFALGYLYFMVSTPKK